MAASFVLHKYAGIASLYTVCLRRDKEAQFFPSWGKFYALTKKIIFLNARAKNAS